MKEKSYLCSQKQNGFTLRRKALIVCALLALAAAPAAAQGIYEAIVATENSIVRVWQERDVVIYNEESPGKGKFLLYTIGTTSALQIDLPINISVKDFEILGDSLWFCGDSTGTALLGGKCGVVGLFNIPNTFAGVDIINYTVLDTFFHNNGYISVLSLNRLDLFPYALDTMMAMTGGSFIDNDSTKKRSTVVSARLQSSGFWQICALIDRDSTIIFTDIAAFGNKVIAVGTSVDGTGLITKSFYQSVYFPRSPIISNYGDSIALLSPIGKALISHLNDNEAAIVQLDENAYTLLHMLDFSTGSAVPSMPTRITDDPNYPYDPEWDLKEIRYNTQTDNISVLEYGIVPPGGNPFETMLWTFPRWVWDPAVPVQTLDIVRQESMDVDIDDRPVTVGKVVNSGMLDVQSYHPASNMTVPNPHDPTPLEPPIVPDPLMEPDACTGYDEVGYIEKEPIVFQILVNDHGSFGNITNHVHQPEVFEIDLSNICQEK